MKYAIRLRSKHTGDSIILGSQYKSREEAMKEASVICCERCNAIDTIPVPDGSVWINKTEGFRKL